VRHYQVALNRINQTNLALVASSVCNVQCMQLGFTSLRCTRCESDFYTNDLQRISFIVHHLLHRSVISCTRSSEPNIEVVVWRSGSALLSINEVSLRRSRLVLGWVTMSGFNSRRRTFISVCSQPPMPTQPGHPFVGRRNEYHQSKGDDALRLETKGRYRSYVDGRYCVIPLINTGHI